MRLELMRVWDPNDLTETPCAICEQTFVAESVLAMTDEGATCPSWIEYLGKRNPGVFPSIEEYEFAKPRFPEPIWAYEEDFEDLDPTWAYTYETSIIERW